MIYFSINPDPTIQMSTTCNVCSEDLPEGTKTVRGRCPQCQKQYRKEPKEEKPKLAQKDPSSTERICVVCDATKTYDAFWSDKRRNPPFTNICKDCGLLCPGCQTRKQANFFYRNPSSATGKRSHCIQCFNDRRSQYNKVKNKITNEGDVTIEKFMELGSITKAEAHLALLEHHYHVRQTKQLKKDKEDNNEAHRHRRQTKARLNAKMWKEFSDVRKKVRNNQELTDREMILKEQLEKMNSRYKCLYCDSSEKLYEKESHALVCGYASKDKINLANHVLRCHSGETVTRQKLREKECASFLDDHKIAYQREITTSKFAVQDSGCTTKARLDFSLQLWPNINVILEVDEYQHRDYLVSCELARMSNIAESFVTDGNYCPTLILRFNPDNYKVVTPEGNVVNGLVKLKDRYMKLLAFFEQKPVLIDGPHLFLAYFFYSFDERSQCPCLFSDDPKFFDQREITTAEVESLKLVKPSVIHCSH